MRQTLERTVFTVRRHAGAWAVEHAGGYGGHSVDMREAEAWACKRAREVVEAGGAAQVLVAGERLLG